MKRFGTFAAIPLLSFALAACALGYSQSQEDKHNDKEQEKSKQQNHGQQNQGHPQQHPGDNGNHYGQQQMQRSEQQEHEQQALQRRAWQERRANHWQYEHRTWEQRGGYHGYRIPDDSFRVNFGRDHWFRVYSLPFQYQSGDPRFQYGGYWFTMLDPFPEDWTGNWYQEDDLYVDYDRDGYYLYNRRYPGRPGIAISVTL
jgi:hypothetical protein